MTLPDLRPRPDESVNVPLLRKVWEQISAHPETWNQQSFVGECGTTMCVAGWAIYMTEGYNDRVYPNSGRTFSEAGADALNMSREEANRVFSNFTDDLDEMHEILNHVAGERL